MKTDAIRVAAIQAAPVFFDRDATVAKVAELAAEAAANNPRLILFPEAFIPAYPRGLSFGAIVGSRTPAGRRLWARYWANSVPVPGPTTEALGADRASSARLSRRGRDRTGRRVRPRHPLLHAALLWAGWRAAGQASQAHAHRRRTRDLGAGRWQHADRARHRDRPHRWADLLGELHAAGPHGALRQGRADLLGAHCRQRARRGRAPCVTSRARGAASCSVATNSSRRATCPRLWRGWKSWQTRQTSCAAAAARSSRRWAMSSPGRSTTGKASSMPISIWCK